MRKRSFPYRHSPQLGSNVSYHNFRKSNKMAGNGFTIHYLYTEMSPVPTSSTYPFPTPTDSFSNPFQTLFKLAAHHFNKFFSTPFPTF